MREQQIANAVAFLSMDCISAYEEELFIPKPLSRCRLDELRKLIWSSVSEKTFHEQHQLTCFRIFTSTNTITPKIWSQIWSWSQLIYLPSIGDRYAERIWSLLLAEHFGKNESDDKPLPFLCSRLDAIAISIRQSRQSADRELYKISEENLSAWDKLVLPQIHIDPEFVVDKIRMIIDLNQLITAWYKEGKFEVDELLELHEWGKIASQKYGVREIDLPFPRSWEYGLIRGEKGGFEGHLGSDLYI